MLSGDPYTATLTPPKAGKHELRAVATDSNGKTGESSCLVNCIASSTNYNLIQTFNTEGSVPQNWYVCNGKTKRVGGGLPYTSECRLLLFTNSTRGFDYGLLVDNPGGKEKSAWARFGDKDGRSCLTLTPGRYGLRYKVCNWNQQEFTPVVVVVEDANGQEVASQTYTPTVNIGGNADNSFTGVKVQTFEFDITETGNYVLSFYTDAVKNADFMLGQATLHAKKFTETGIREVPCDNLPAANRTCYDLSGRSIDNGGSHTPLKPGLYIIRGRKVVIK